MVAILILQWDDGAYLYVLRVKLAIDGEDLLVQVDDTLVIVLTVSLLWLQLKVELLALSQVYYLLLECRQGNAHAADEEERALVGSALDEHFFTITSLSYVIECV